MICGVCSTEGGFLGDKPGLGKTTIMIGVTVLTRELDVAIEEVATARQKGDFSIHTALDDPEGCLVLPKQQSSRCMSRESYASTSASTC
jgi:hypothetical protein